jgi:hypothetical protein
MEQTHIQAMIDGSSAEQRLEYRRSAELTLAQINAIIGRKVLSREEKKAADLAIELLARLDATDKGGGWWFRTKRRLQITQMYLGA